MGPKAPKGASPLLPIWGSRLRCAARVHFQTGPLAVVMVVLTDYYFWRSPLSSAACRSCGLQPSQRPEEHLEKLGTRPEEDRDKTGTKTGEGRDETW